MSLSPDFLAAGIDSPVTMDSSTAPLPSSTSPSTGTPSPGRTLRTVADLNQLQRDFLVLAVGFQAARRLGSQFQQGADRAASLVAGAQFEHLAQQHKNGDHRRGL